MRKKIAIAGLLTISILVGLYLISRLGVKTYMLDIFLPEEHFTLIRAYVERPDGTEQDLPMVTEEEIRRTFAGKEVSNSGGLPGVINQMPEIQDTQDAICMLISDTDGYQFFFRFYRNGFSWFVCHAPDEYPYRKPPAGIADMFDDGTCFRAMEELFQK